MEMGYKALKEQSLDQKAFASVFTPKSAENYLKNYLKPGDKGYMNRGMVMEMGYKALKEAMTNPLADQNPLRNPAQSQDPNRGLGLITLRLR